MVSPFNSEANRSLNRTGDASGAAMIQIRPPAAAKDRKSLYDCSGRSTTP